MINKTLHDINGYLAAVLGNIEVAILKFPEAFNYLSEAKERLKNAVDLINTLFVVEKEVVIDKRDVAILLADDEYYVLKILREMLTEINYDVEVAKDGDEAVQIFAKNPEKYALVILDVAMPRKNGVDTFIAMKNIRPDIPIIMISGYLEKMLSDKLKKLELAGFLQKPILMSDLFVKVEEILKNRGIKR